LIRVTKPAMGTKRGNLCLFHAGSSTLLSLMR
jgi:hypothetical protein